MFLVAKLPNVPEILTRQILFLSDRNKQLEIGELAEEGSFESTEFVAHMTPLMLACHLNNYEMVRLLLRRGHTITLSAEGKVTGFSKCGVFTN